MAEAVTEVVAEAGGFDQAARRRVHALAACPGGDGGKPRELRVEADLVRPRRVRPAAPVANVRVQSEQ